MPGMPALRPCLSLVTLGVADVGRARLFYETLGFQASSASQEGVTFFDAGGVVLALFGRAALADDAGVCEHGEGFFGVALACNVAGEDDVGALLSRAEAAGGRIVKAAQRAFWGGWSGYFADPDGHLWEVAHNPFFALTEDGRVILPPPHASP